MKPITIKKIVEVVNGTLLCGDESKEITSVSTNSKEIETGALFVPIIGERVDAHRFIDMAFEKGAVVAFTSRHESAEGLSCERALIKVENTVDALQSLGAYYRSLFPIPLIGITGSVGKTTTKEMIAAALETRKNVLKTEGNMNSQVGLPLMMFRFQEEHEIAIIEMGMSEEGEMSRLAEIAKPDMAVLTNIGVSHIAQLGSKENIRKEKMNIMNTFSESAKHENILFLNGNDVLLAKLKEVQEKEEETGVLSKVTKEKLKLAKIVTFGTEESCTYYAKNIKTVGEETHFTLVYPNGTEEIVLSVLGVHNVNNALVSLAIAMYFGIEPNVAKEGLKAYKPIAMRGQISEKDGIKIIDDTYNASPDSMKSGIHVLMEMEDLERRIAVLADVLELGEVSFDCHYEIGTFIAQQAKGNKKIDEVVTIGTEAQAIVKAIEEANADINTHAFLCNEDAATYLKDILKMGDAVMIKGSRGMHTEEIVKVLKQS